MDKFSGSPQEHCRAEDGRWVIYLWPMAKYTEAGEWVDCWHVIVPLPEGITSPWSSDATTITVSATFDTYEEAWAHVSRPDLMVWALTVHAQDLTQAVVYWRRRAEDADPTSKKFRASAFLDDIRCAILDTGWPLGDDSDPELTPVRLVKEVLAYAAQLTEWNNKQGDTLRRHLPDLFPSPKYEYRLPDFCEKKEKDQ